MTRAELSVRADAWGAYLAPKPTMLDRVGAFLTRFAEVVGPYAEKFLRLSERERVGKHRPANGRWRPAYRLPDFGPRILVNAPSQA